MDFKHTKRRRILTQLVLVLGQHDCCIQNGQSCQEICNCNNQEPETLSVGDVKIKLLDLVLYCIVLYYEALY